MLTHPRVPPLSSKRASMVLLLLHTVVSPVYADNPPRLGSAINLEGWECHDDGGCTKSGTFSGRNGTWSVRVVDARVVETAFQTYWIDRDAPMDPKFRVQSGDTPAHAASTWSQELLRRFRNHGWQLERQATDPSTGGSVAVLASRNDRLQLVELPNRLERDADVATGGGWVDTVMVQIRWLRSSEDAR